MVVAGVAAVGVAVAADAEVAVVAAAEAAVAAALHGVHAASASRTSFRSHCLTKGIMAGLDDIDPAASYPDGLLHRPSPINLASAAFR